MKFHTEQTNRTLPTLTCSELLSFPTLLKYSFTVILDFSFSWTITGFIRIDWDDLGQFLLWSQLQASENYAEKNSSKLKSHLKDNDLNLSPEILTPMWKADIFLSRKQSRANGSCISWHEKRGVRHLSAASGWWREAHPAVCGSETDEPARSSVLHAVSGRSSRCTRGTRQI